MGIGSEGGYGTSGGGVILADNEKIELGGSSELYYDGNDTVWELEVAGSGGLMLSLDSSTPPSPDDGGVHIWDGSAGNVDAVASSVLTLEKDGNINLTFLTPNSSVQRIRFGDSDNNVVGSFGYDHGNTRMLFRIENSDRLYYSAGTFAFQEATTISTTAGDLILSPTGNVRIDDTAAADTNSVSHIATPSGVSGTQAGWLEINVGGTVSYVPFFQ